MQSRQNSQLNKKKAAFRTKIRRQWLDNYFQQKRTELFKNQQAQMQTTQMLNKRCQELMERLPESNAVDQLAVEYQKNKEGVVNFVKENLRKFMETSLQLGLKAFYLYIDILANIAVYYQNSTNEIMQVTMRQIIGQGTRLIKQNQMGQHVVLKGLVEYILILSDCFSSMDIILMKNITTLLDAAFSSPNHYMHHNDIKECYIIAIQSVNQFLMASVNGLHQKEDQENIDQKDQDNLAYLRHQFITEMFIKHPQNINFIVAKAAMYPSDSRIITTTLKVLTNLTYFSQEPIIYEKLFDSLVEHLIFSVLSCFPKIRMINNLFMFSKQTTDIFIRNFYIPQLIKAYNSIKEQNIDIVEEMCEMLSHVVQFMEDYNHDEALKYLMEKQLIDIFIEGCHLITKPELLSHIVCNFSILIKAYKDEVSMKVRQNESIFRRVEQNGDETLAQMTNHFLELCFKQTSEDYSNLSENMSTSTDVEI